MTSIQLQDKARIHYVTRGSGDKKALFIHGNLANSLWWESTLAQLPADFEAVALDLPGSGATQETGVRHTMEYFAKLIDEFTELLGWQQFYLVGHSMGGGIAQLLAIRRPQKVLKLVLLNAMAADGFHTIIDNGLWRMEKAMQDKAFLTKAIRATAPMCRDEALLAKLIDSTTSASPQVFLEQPVTMHEANWMARLPEIRCSTLFLHGELDDFVPKAGSEKTAKAIPNCTFKYLKNCGHSPMLEVFDDYFREVFTFLQAETLKS